ncbi:MAG TPA: sulfite exporter TauE/SafE family protein [Candidatus Anoxymicrobiaceae bacterium]
MENGAEVRERTYYVQGMNCAACEIVLEKKLVGLAGVRSVAASVAKGTVLVEHEGKALAVGRLNQLFEEDGYRFSLNPAGKAGETPRKVSYGKVGIAALVALVLVVLLQKAGLSRLVTVNAKSALPAFLLLGLVAGFSSCAALVGGIVLSMSKQWGELYSPEEPFKKRMEPHLLFNTGRLIAFVGFGALLALVGSAFRFTPSFSAILVIVISIVMVLLGLQMLGVRFLRSFQFTMPKRMTRYIADERHFKGRYMPFALGALTFFLPCGFAITAEGFALLSGKPLQGGLIMLMFALGTLPMLLIIAFSSVKFLAKPRTAATFLKVAGILVLFFAIFNINNQLVVLNAPNLGDLFGHATAVSRSVGGSAQQPAATGGKQVIKMEASASGYSPDSFTVKAGQPVLWEVKDTGTRGCTNAIISGGLFDGQISLTPGTTSTKEFTPTKPGRYRFSCWMGMVTGVIEVVDAKATTGGGGASKVTTPKAASPAAGG